MTFTAPTAIADIGVTGLGVMGANLARNLARNGFKVAVHNRSIGRTQRLIADHGAEGEFFPSESVENFVASLSTPRVAIIMVQAGPPTDAVIEQLATHMDPGDIIVDCGNSQYQDTDVGKLPCASAACTSWELASLEARRAHCSARRSCPVARSNPTIVSAPCSRLSQRRPTASPAARTSAPMERATL